jgi:ATP-binding cassette, subfamily F, member 3
MLNYEFISIILMNSSQQTYEEMFMKINPLDAAAAAKNKSKDIHLPTIDVNFGSNRILCEH